MAFVSCSERKFDPLINTPDNIGPGTYQNPASKNGSYGAPFLSTSIRPNIQVVPKALLPGPGDYDIRTNIADPVIQAMANSRNIIVKINSTGTGPFKSTQNRFSQSDSSVPGPGSCSSTIIQIMLMSCLRKRKEPMTVLEQKGLERIAKTRKEAQAFLTKERLCTQTMKKSNK